MIFPLTRSVYIATVWGRRISGEKNDHPRRGFHACESVAHETRRRHHRPPGRPDTLRPMKYPPYARELDRQRALGDHPQKIFVLFGTNWDRRPQGALCVRPEDYRPGLYRLDVCRGIRTHVVERERIQSPGRDALRLAAEIAEHTAPVYFHWIAGIEDWPCIAGTPAMEEISSLIRCNVAGDQVRFEWPGYWDKRRRKAYEARKAAYWHAARALVSRRPDEFG